MKEYLILLSGSPRGGLSSWKTLIKYVKNPLEADLALLYGDIFEVPPYLLKHAKFDWKFEEPKNWRIFYEKNFSNDNAINLLINGEEYGMAGGIDNYSGSGAIVSGFKIIISNNYLNELSNYKYIIHSRFDQYYTDYHPKFAGENIWIPENEDYFGIFDRHAILSNNFIERYFAIADYLDSEQAMINMKDKPISPESVFLEHLKFQKIDNEVQRIKRFQFTSATAKDNTRWRKAIYKLHLSKGIMIKYPDEFLFSIHNSINKSKIKYIFRHPVLCLNYFYLILRQTAGSFLKKNRNNS